MPRYAMVILVVLALLLPACGGSAEKEAAAQRDQYQQEVTKLQNRVTELEGEVKALKEAPQEMLRQAFEARERGDFDQAGKLLDDLETKYPAIPEVAKVPAARDQLKQAMAAKKEADRTAFETAMTKAKAETTPEKAKAVLQDYLSQNASSAFRADVEKKIATYDEQIRVAAEEAKKPPVEVLAAEMGENSIGTPEINLSLRNRTQKTIDGFEFSVDLYDNYDRPVNRYRSQYDGNTFNGIAQEKISPGGKVYWTWTMYGFDLATKYKNLRIRSVHFTDGTTWSP